MSNQTLQTKRDKEHATRTVFKNAGEAFNDNASVEAVSDRRLLSGLSWAWIALSAMATCVWLVAAGWMAVRFFRWLVD